MDYSKLSDFEINKRVAECRGGFGGSTNNKYAPDEVICYDEKPFHTERDFCNNPSDAWSIIVENKICIQYEEAFREAWEVSYCKHINDYEVKIIGPVWNDNPLRAAMIVYLMMQEA